MRANDPAAVGISGPGDGTRISLVLLASVPPAGRDATSAGTMVAAQGTTVRVQLVRPLAARARAEAAF